MQPDNGYIFGKFSPGICSLAGIAVLCAIGQGHRIRTAPGGDANGFVHIIYRKLQCNRLALPVAGTAHFKGRTGKGRHKTVACGIHHHFGFQFCQAHGGADLQTGDMIFVFDHICNHGLQVHVYPVIYAQL